MKRTAMVAGSGFLKRLRGPIYVARIADVLHHEEDPDALTRECARVARRFLILKDVQRDVLVCRYPTAPYVRARGVTNPVSTSS